VLSHKYRCGPKKEDTLTITIRKAHANDARAISELIVPLTKRYICPTCEASAYELLLGSMSEEKIATYLVSNFDYLVAETKNKEVIGVGGMRDNSHLYHLFVSDQYQGQGLSRQLWDCLKEQAMIKGNRGAFSVNSAVNAEAVYSSFGFKRKAGIRNQHGVIDIPMVLEVAQIDD